jgi:K+-sensing histidine kinase KdpD
MTKEVWHLNKTGSREERADQGASMSQRVTQGVRIGIGVLLSAAAAMAASLLFAAQPWRVFVPLAFVVVLVLIASRYGLAVAVIGSALTAIIFAHFLFAPVGSLRVDSSSARTNLAWMILTAIAVSYLLFPTHRMGNRK